MQLVRDRYASAHTGWTQIRKDFRDDIRFISGEPTDQWDPQVKSNRDQDGIPALTMDRINPLINSIVNQARKDRPQPKVTPNDDGDPQTAEALEGKVRHVMYVSHADVAFDCAEMYCASGGIGYYEVVKEYSTKRGFDQEPRVRRIADPMTIYFDPAVTEADYSDAEYCFQRKRYRRETFKREFKVEPQPFPFEEDTAGDWGDEDYVWIAKYWWVEEKEHRHVSLVDGREGFIQDLDGADEDAIVAERPVKERIVHCDIVDGGRRLEESIWEGEWIPIFPVTGKEVISAGIRRYVSAVRYARDPQMFLNASMSATAESLATVNHAPYIGPKGAFKDRKWRDGKRHFYLEYEVINIAGQPASPPQRNAFEPAIQGTTSASAQAIDALKGSVGYVDSVTRPSQADISGIAVQRRDEQANQANMHYEDSLVQSMWHFGRVLVDLLILLADTPRVWQTRSEDGTQRPVPITMDVDQGTYPLVPGWEQHPHVKIDDGDYGVVIDVGPSFPAKQEEEAAFLTAMVQAMPALFPAYAPAIFKRRGYHDLEAIAEAMQPPQIQQAMAAKNGQGMNPQQAAAQLAQLQQQNQQLMQALQQIGQVIKTKQIEAQGRLEVEKAKTIREIIVETLRNNHDATSQLTGHQADATKHMLEMFHESELAPDPMQQMAPQGGVQ